VTADRWQITTDGVTVWVCNEHGATLGRFGKQGIDIHSGKPDADTECLYCTHVPTTLDDWFVFVGAMIAFHGIQVDPRNYMPDRFRGPR
jgi:hypothetical protein